MRSFSAPRLMIVCGRALLGERTLVTIRPPVHGLAHGAFRVSKQAFEPLVEKLANSSRRSAVGAMAWDRRMSFSSCGLMPAADSMRGR